jgi:hypothetical protein
MIKISSSDLKGENIFNNIAIQNILQSKKPLLLILAKFCTKKMNDTMWLKEWGKKKSSKIVICDEKHNDKEIPFH